MCSTRNGNGKIVYIWSNEEQGSGHIDINERKKQFLEEGSPEHPFTMRQVCTFRTKPVWENLPWLLNLYYEYIHVSFRGQALIGVKSL